MVLSADKNTACRKGSAGYIMFVVRKVMKSSLKNNKSASAKVAVSINGIRYNRHFL
jgi:hypothetical protein